MTPPRRPVVPPRAPAAHHEQEGAPVRPSKKIVLAFPAVVAAVASAALAGPVPSAEASAGREHRPAPSALGGWAGTGSRAAPWWALRTVRQEDAVGTLWYHPGQRSWHADIRDAPVGSEVSGQEEHGSRGERATVPMGASSVNTPDWFGGGSFRVCVQLPARPRVCSTYANPEGRLRTAASHRIAASHHRAYPDFRVPGVVIWDNPLNTARRVGLGYPGQKFDAIRGSGPWDYYSCDNGVTSNFWIYGRNMATGVVGWVPDCNLTPS
ncbi:hypothetical protein AB0C69_05020 [Actinomadura sp. NPDC048032]|uniref:hypothetical protein n=1 Tax=Actinomadura sp. NPDC048032 TaxID=3155747 RepID=UPI0033F93070